MNGPVLVTGGNGFLGSSVVLALAEQGCNVISADLRLPERADARIRNVVMDVTDADAVDTVIAGARPEVVVHLASVVTPGKDSSRELEYAVDVTGSNHVLAACLDHGVRRVVVSSSGAAYGYHPDNGASHQGSLRGWLTEDDPVRGNVEFAYSDHKRLVEERLAELRETHPALEQVVLRIGTILGLRVDNQITALFESKRLLKIRGAHSCFVFAWDTDVAAVIARAVTGPVTGIFNVAGDGAMSVEDIAAASGRPTIAVPAAVLRWALRIGRRLGLTPYGPEQVRFLQYRPVLHNGRLKEDFGYQPEYTSREAFEAWLRRH